ALACACLLLTTRAEERAGDDVRQRLRDADQRLVEAMREELRDPSACPHDPRLCVEAHDRDPERLIAFVRDEIGYEPYPGLARGRIGTLMAGAGNALDKCALLAELLRDAGCEARVRAGRIAEGAAARLIARAAAAVPAASATLPASARPADEARIA